MNAQTTSRVDLHCHSTASQEAKLGVQRALGLPECATPPEEVYALAKRRGMDFVTITDHDTIDGALEIADRPDVFVSEELTVRFRGEPQAVHVLCYGITPDDHEWLQAHNGDVETLRRLPARARHRLRAGAPVLRGRRAADAAATAGAWRSSSRSGRRATARARASSTSAGRDLHRDPRRNRHRRHPTTTPASTSGGRSPRRRPPRRRKSFSPTCARAAPGRAARRAAPRSGRTPRWRSPRASLGDEKGAEPDPSPSSPWSSASCARATPAAAPSAPTSVPRTRAALLEAWLRSVGVEARGRAFLEELQADGFSHADLYRRARRAHERALKGVGLGRPRLRAGSADLGALVAGSSPPACRRCPTRRRPPSRAARPRACAAAARRRCASRSSPTGWARCTASPARSRRSASAACPASTSRSSAPTPTSTAACPPSPTSSCPSPRPADRRAERARRWSRRSPRATTTSCTSARPGPAASAPR